MLNLTFSKPVVSSVQNKGNKTDCEKQVKEEDYWQERKLDAEGSDGIHNVFKVLKILYSFKIICLQQAKKNVRKLYSS